MFPQTCLISVCTWLMSPSSSLVCSMSSSCSSLRHSLYYFLSRLDTISPWPILSGIAWMCGVELMSCCFFWVSAALRFWRDWSSSIIARFAISCSSRRFFNIACFSSSSLARAAAFSALSSYGWVVDYRTGADACVFLRKSLEHWTQISESFALLRINGTLQSSYIKRKEALTFTSVLEHGPSR